VAHLFLLVHILHVFALVATHPSLYVKTAGA